MRPEINRMGKKVTGITYYCDKCEYGFEASLPYANGEMVRYSDGKSSEPREVMAPPGPPKHPA